MSAKYSILPVLAAMMMTAAHAQETYQSANLATSDLNGTARYVGMGGAMEALGADISTISSNPAGVGMFRKAQISISGGGIFQSGESNMVYDGNTTMRFSGDKNHASFDQIGAVLPLRVGSKSFLNVGFNYHKSRNFDQLLTACNILNKASQNKLSAIKYDLVGDWAWNGVDACYQDLLESQADDGTKYLGYYEGNPIGSSYCFGKYQNGYIGEYDLNLSGAIGDRVYLGVTVGIHDVNYKSDSYYNETLWTGKGSGSLSEALGKQYRVGCDESLRIDGTGYDVKFGAIFFPVDGSPFRVGAYIHTPVFYDLSMAGGVTVRMHGDEEGDASASHGATYDYRVNTPWKFGVSLGHTVNNVLALGATYEYADYGSIDNRIIDGGYYDSFYGDAYETSSSDEVMNAHTERTLKGVHTLKLGAEFRPIPVLALRAGYNYVSAAYNENGFRDGSLESPGVGYATSTDYTNWKATNRFTLGLGWQATKKLNIDVAYQHSKTDGVFYPFMSYVDNADPNMDNVAYGTDVSHKRHQLLATLSYRF